MNMTHVGILWLALFTGCVQVLGISSPGESAGAPDGGPDAQQAPDAEVCSDLTATALGTTPFDTTTASDGRTLTCSSGAGNDVVLGWTAPTTDYYAFDTFGSSFDTVLALIDGCSGSELACNNNTGALSQSELVRKFEQGAQALVVVDGFAGDKGEGQLDIARVTCPDADLEGQAFPLSLSTAGFGDDLSSPCGGAGHDDRAYHWVAPTDGIYQFDVTSTQFAPTINLIDGARCGDRALGCNAALDGENGAHVVRRLKQGQRVSLVVDGKDGAGPFQVAVSERVTPTCPQYTLAMNMPQTVQLTSARSLAPSCGIAKGGALMTGADHQDATFAFAMPTLGMGCHGGCSFHAESSSPFSTYVLDQGDCGGAELSCAKGVDDGSGTGHFVGDLQLNAAEGPAQTITIVISNDFPDVLPMVTLTASCGFVC